MANSGARLPPPGVMPSDRATDQTGTFARRLAEGLPEDSAFVELMKRRQRLEERRAEREYREQMRLRNLEARWDSTVHKNIPDPLRGCKPITREPWARDAIIYAKCTGSFEEEYGVKAVEAYNDESVYDSNNGYVTTTSSSPGGGNGGKTSSAFGEVDSWNYSTFRHRPVTLRGMRPGGKEPWNNDEKVLGIYREWIGKEGELAAMLQEEPARGGMPSQLAVQAEASGRSTSEVWANEAKSLFESLTKGASSLFNWAKLSSGQQPKALKGPGEKAGVLQIGKGTPFRGKNADRNDDPKDVGDKARDPTATFRYDGMNSWSAWAESLNPADRAMLEKYSA